MMMKMKVVMMMMVMMVVVMMKKKVMMMMVVMMMKKKMILEVQAGSIWGYKQDTAPACSHCWHCFFLQLFFCSPPAFCWNWTPLVWHEECFALSSARSHQASLTV